MDEGQLVSERYLRVLQNKIEKEYRQASREVTAKAEKYFARFEKNDAKMISKLQSGEITRDDYNKWRVREMIIGEKWNEMKNSLADDLVNTDKVAAKMIRDTMPQVYAENFNFGTFDVERASNLDTSFSLMNEEAVGRLLRKNPKLLPKPRVDIPKDKQWNKQKIQSAVTQGILQGESMKDVAKRLQSVTDMDKVAAMRNARTAVTGAENGGRLDAYRRAAAMGIAIKKKWMSTLDHVTRSSHVDMDGEEQEIDHQFSNGLDFPGGMGPPEEVYNCRCCVVPSYDKYKTDFSDMNLRNTDKLGDMSYDDWKKSRGGKKEKKQGGAKKAFNRDEWMARLEKQDGMEEKLRGWFHDWRDKLTSPEYNGVSAYTGSSYREMNEYLRGISDYVSPRNVEAIENARSALEKASLPEDLILRRGVDGHGIDGLFKMNGNEFADLVKGGKFDDKFAQSIVADKAFISASAKPDGGFDERFELVINTPKGTRAMYVDPMSRNKGEEETLIHDNCAFRVEGAEPMGNWGARIFLTLLN